MKKLALLLTFVLTTALSHAQLADIPKGVTAAQHIKTHLQELSKEKAMLEERTEKIEYAIRLYTILYFLHVNYENANEEMQKFLDKLIDIGEGEGK
jgi:hypothetical protein